MAGLAAALGLSTWLLLTILVPVRLPEDFPKPPDVQPLNPGLRNLLVGADAEARSHPGSAEVIGRLGMAYHSNQFFEQAASAYRIAARLAPDDYRWAYCHALLQEESGREKEQFDLLQETVRLKPDHIPALQKLADVYFKRDKPDEAVRYYEMSIRAAGRDSSLQALFGLGRIAARRQDWNKVIEYVEPISRAYPHVRPPYQLLLNAYEALGLVDKAAEARANLLQPKLIVVPPVKDALNEQLISLSYSSTRLLKEAGLLSRFGDPDQSIRVARRAAEVEPEDADARHLIARTLLSAQGDKPEAVDEALTQVGEGLRLRPDDMMPLWDFASSFFEHQKTAAAVERLRTMLARNANRDDANYYLGLVADQQGRTQEAVAQYQAALKSNPNNAEAHNKLGLILVTQGKLDQAIAHFQKSVHLNPMFSIARFNLGVALVQRGKIGQALIELAEALRLKPNDAPTHLYLAVALMESGKIDEAIAHFRETLRFKPEEVQAHYGLGSALATQRKREEAVKELREALRLRPDYPEARDLLQKLEQRSD